MQPFSLLLFSTDHGLIRSAVASGVDGIIVDWENTGKKDRQGLADTEINADTLDDLLRVRASTQARVICRINGYGRTTEEEIEQAVAAGVDELLLPMVQTVGEVEAVLGRVHGRCGVGILLETAAALTIAEPLSALPLSRIYVGLNDLAIERRTPNIFTALIDGTVERLRQAFGGAFGLGGLTLPDRGFPIPCRLLMGEMVRLRCSFSFLRRSFHRDVRGRDPHIEIPRILEAVHRMRQRTPEVVVQDRIDLETAVAAWTTDWWFNTVAAGNA